MLEQSSAELVQYLSNPNGWWRETAQKLIVLRGDKSVVPALEELAKNSPMPLARIHALWTLNGLASLDENLLLRALKDNDAQVRKTAVWISEDFMKNNNAKLLDRLETLKDDTSADVRYQLALSLRYNGSDKAKAIVNYLANGPSNRIAAISQKKYTDVLAAREAIAQKERMMREADRLLVTNGAVIFKSLCSSCHGEDGKGINNGGKVPPAPPLANNKDVNGDPDKLIRILLYGLTGPVDGKTYANTMPALNGNDDTYIASAISYIRNDFGNKAHTVTAEQVKKIREANAGRIKSWTMEELDAIKK